MYNCYECFILIDKNLRYLHFIKKSSSILKYYIIQHEHVPGDKKNLNKIDIFRVNYRTSENQ